MVILSKGAGAKRALLRRGGTPGETRTHYLTLRRRTLCPGELRGLMQKLFNFPAQQETNQLPLRRTTNSLSYDSLTLHPALFCVNLAQCVFGFSRCFASFCTVLRCWNTFRAISKKLADGIFELFKKTKLADY